MSTLKTESTSMGGLSQRKRFRSSSGSDKLENSSLSSHDAHHQYPSVQRNPNDDFDLSFPPLRAITVQSSDDGTPPVIHIPDVVCRVHLQL